MYENTKSFVCLNGQFSGKFSIYVVVHQGAVLSPLLFMIVMESLSREFKVGCPLGVALHRWSGVNSRDMKRNFWELSGKK